MSHEIRHFEYKDNIKRDWVQGELDNFVKHEDWQEGCSGLAAPIRWCEQVICDSYDDAEKWIEEHDRGYYDQLAVRFRDTSSAKSKKISELESKLREASIGWRDAETQRYADTVKSSFVGCKKCGSKLAREYLRNTNLCPLCRTDFRSPTTLASIAAKKEKMEHIRQMLADEKKKVGSKNGEVKWLVKIEYHM